MVAFCKGLGTCEVTRIRVPVIAEQIWLLKSIGCEYSSTTAPNKNIDILLGLGNKGSFRLTAITHYVKLETLLQAVQLCQLIADSAMDTIQLE